MGKGGDFRSPFSVEEFVSMHFRRPFPGAEKVQTERTRCSGSTDSVILVACVRR